MIAAGVTASTELNDESAIIRRPPMKSFSLDQSSSAIGSPPDSVSTIEPQRSIDAPFTLRSALKKQSDSETDRSRLIKQSKSLFPKASSSDSKDSLDVIGKRARFASSSSTTTGTSVTSSQSVDVGRKKRSARLTATATDSDRDSSVDDPTDGDDDDDEFPPPSPPADSLPAIELQHRRQMYACKARAKLQFGSRGTGPGEFTWPKDVAIISSRHSSVQHRIAVADSGNHRCQLFDAFGNFLLQFGTGSDHHRIQIGELASLVASDDDRLIVTDRQRHRVLLFDFQGNLLREFGSLGDQPSELRQPCGVAFEPSERTVYVCDQGNRRLQVFGLEGNFRRVFAQTSSSSSSSSFAGTRSSTSLGGASVVKLLPKSASVVLPASCCPYFVAIHHDLLLLSDTAQHVVTLFKWKSGRKLLTLGGEGSALGKFKYPRGVAIDSNGFLVVADAGNNRLQVFNPDGSFLKVSTRFNS